MSLLARETVDLILASASPSRAALLEGTGLTFRRIPADVDESAIRAALSEGDTVVEPVDVAEILARAKAEEVSRAHPGALVIGADQILTLDGRIFEKPPDMAAARATLLDLRGRTHELQAAIVVAREGETIWSHTDTARMTMRDFSAEFLGRYLALAGEDVLSSVGAYKLESHGVHLFSGIDGDYFTILGLPLLPLLEFLRGEAAIDS